MAIAEENATPKLTTPEAMLERVVELLETIAENTAPAEEPADEEG